MLDGWKKLIDKDNMETLDKTKSYEKEQEEIKVGDVISDGVYVGIITAIYEDGQIVKATYGNRNNKEIDILFQSGMVGLRCYLKHYKKTGKHIDISGLLAEIGDAE